MEEIKKIQENLKQGKALTMYSEKELKYLETPIGKAIYDYSVRDKKDTDEIGPVVAINSERVYKQWYDKVKCDVCGAVVVRSNQSQHKKTQKHLAYANMNTKIRELLLNKI